MYEDLTILVVVIIFIKVIIIIVVVVIEIIIVVVKEIVILIIKFRDVISFIINEIFFDLDFFDCLFLILKIKIFKVFVLKVQIFIIFKDFFLVVPSINLVQKQ